MRVLITVFFGVAFGSAFAAMAATKVAPLAAPPAMPPASAAPAANAAPAVPAKDEPASTATSPGLTTSLTTPGTAPAAALGELGEPSAQEQLPPAHPIAPDTRIEQIRQGNRVVEIRVTPAGTSRSYVIVTREPSRPQSLQESGTGLSTPRFVRFEF